MTKFMSKSNNCNQSAIIFRIILCCGISLVLGAVLGHLLRTELFADINAEFEQILLALDTKSIHYPSLFRYIAGIRRDRGWILYPKQAVFVQIQH